MTRDRPLARVLGPWDGAAIAVGIVIGSGIFRTPGSVAKATGTPGLFLGVWVLGGILALLDALIIAELASLYPRAGGNYVFLKNAYGPFPAFMNGWLSTLVTFPASNAAFAVFFSECLMRLQGKGAAPSMPVAWALLLGLGGVNALGLRYGRVTQLVFAGAKLLLLILVVALGLFVTAAPPATAAPAVVPPATFAALMAGMGSALLGVMWTYDGYSDVAAMAGEIRSPGRNIPRALMGSMVAIAAVYLLANVSFLVALPFDALAASSLVVSDVAKATLGASAESVVTVIAMISAFGALNGTLIAGPRITYAIAADGLMFRSLARVTKGQTPILALAVQIAMSIALTFRLPGGASAFDVLSGSAIFVVWVVTFFAGLSLVVFRVRYPDAPRPFRLPFYPYTFVLHLLVSLGFLATTLATAFEKVQIGVYIILAGIPVYAVWARVAHPPARRLSPAESALESGEPAPA